MGEILIQPLIANFDSYNQYARKKRFSFEIIDFAFPSIIENTWKQRVNEYLKLRKDGKKFLGMHGWFMDIYINSPDPGIRKISEERILRNLQIAQRLGIKYVIFHTNSLPMMEKRAYYDNWANAHIAFWKKTLKQFNITVLLENMWDKNPDALLRVIQGVNSKKLKVCFDTGHCNVFSEVTMEQWFKRLGKNIVYIHLNDNNGEGDFELPPGEGNIDWKRFDKYIKKYCSSPHIVLEVKDLTAIEKSVDYLKKNSIYPFHKR